MIKLIALVIALTLAVLFLPEILALVAGVVLIGALGALLISGVGFVFSCFGSAAASLVGGLFSVLLALAILAIIGVSIPLLLLILVPIGLMLLLGGLFFTVLCGVV